MKYIAVTIFLLSFSNCFAQNSLADLYTMEPGNHYPTNMPHVKQWVGAVLNPVFVRNLQSSDNSKSSSKFLSFSVAIRPGTGFVLPNTNGLKLIPAKGAYRMQYDQEILNYKPFDVNAFDYTQKSYFLLAKDILRITSEQLIANTLNFFVPDGKGDKYDLFIDAINRQKGITLPSPAEKKVSSISAILEKQFPGKVPDVIFETYIQGNSDVKTTANIQRFFAVTRFFQGPVDSRLNDMMNPKFQLRQNTPQSIVFPVTMITQPGAAHDSLTVFQCDYVKGVLNYKETQLEITFSGHLNHNAIMTSGKRIDYDAKGKRLLVTPTNTFAEPKDLKELDLIVGEGSVQLIAVTPDETRYLLFENKWK